MYWDNFLLTDFLGEWLTDVCIIISIKHQTEIMGRSSCSKGWILSWKLRSVEVWSNKCILELFWFRPALQRCDSHPLALKLTSLEERHFSSFIVITDSIIFLNWIYNIQLILATNSWYQRAVWEIAYFFYKYHHVLSYFKIIFYLLLNK